MKYEELSPKAHARAKDVLRSWADDDDSNAEWVIENFTALLNLWGYCTVETSYGGFSSQGDGASFTGRWSADRFQFAEVMETAPKDEVLTALAVRTLAVTMQYPYAGVNIYRRNSRYSHDKIMGVTAHNDNEEYDASYDDEILDISQALARWFYKQLEAEHDYAQSDEGLADRADGTDFDEDGKPL